jgi:S-(hydroxymethyl)glutathione dehydrogenase/alcohol dehydrogenase
MRMKAAVMYEPKKPLIVEEVQLDPPKANEVLVKLAATGVCHSDVHFYTGDLPAQMPMVPGHEGAGIVQEVGPGVTRVKAGDKVVLSFLPSCGQCRMCVEGRTNLCDLGAQLMAGVMLDQTPRLHSVRDGSPIRNFLFVSTWAEYTVVPDACLVKVRDETPLEKACLFGCGFTTGYGAVTNTIHIRPGESITIVGCGGLGLSAIQGAAASDAGMIVAVDVHEEKLALAKKMGATHVVQNRHNVDEVVKEVLHLTQGLGTDYSGEFVGFDQTPETADIAFRSVRKGGTMLLVGVGALSQQTLKVSPFVLTMYEKRIQGVLFGSARFRTDIPRYVELLLAGKLNLDEMITNQFRLEDINTCIANVLAGNKVGRQVIRFS